MNFSKLIELIRNILDVQVDAVILNSCYSAAELIDENSQNYICSPARVLRIYLQNIPILGYIGIYNETNVTGLFTPQENYNRTIYDSNDEDKVVFNKHYASLLLGSVMFKNGKVTSSSDDSQDIYTSCTYIPDFVAELIRKPGLTNNSK
ncbi:MAG: hypothetical protein EP298_13445 [Gammaproteobacteria bacterium]|nr:MAG: hypothetical protein EP298_13445 [Gammaproteobacteria bacterium]UTW41717.1 hypothetical protein KFE69_09390 [bacterium SCSIO 12844]